MIAPVFSRSAVPVPPLKIYRYFLRGMEQQMWFFGQDARHGGNLLRRHGFESFRTGETKVLVVSKATSAKVPFV